MNALTASEAAVRLKDSPVLQPLAQTLDPLALDDAALCAALERLRFGGGADAPSPLDHLMIVDEVLTASELPDTHVTRRFVLCELLVSVIRAEFERLRALNSLEPVDPNAARVTTLAAIAEDAMTGSAVLLGWGWLYYDYVRAELEITVSQYCAAAGIHERTLQRYRHQALGRLQFQLIQREHIARSEQHRLRLLRQLPSRKLPPLVGQGIALNALDVLADGWRPSHVQIVGAPGIGKTTLIHSLLRRWINASAIDHIVWLTAPASIDAAQDSLSRSLVDAGIHVPIREAPRCHTVIVLEDATGLAGDLRGLEALLDTLEGALVLMTTQTPRYARNIDQYVVLRELSESDAKALIRNHLSQWHLPGVSWCAEDVQHIWCQSGGNPLRIEHVTAACCRSQLECEKNPIRLTQPYRRLLSG